MYKKIAKFQHYCVRKKIQCLPNQTQSYMCESLLGLPKLSYEIDKRKLYFLRKHIVMPESSVTKQFSFRPLGFIPDIMVILQKYNLVNYIHEYSLNHTFPNTSAQQLQISVLLCGITWLIPYHQTVV